MDIGQYQKSEEYIRESIRQREALLGPSHPDVAMSLTNLGGLFVASSSFLQAIPIFERAREIYQKTFGDDHPGVGQCLNSLGGIQTELGTPSPTHTRA